MRPCRRRSGVHFMLAQSQSFTLERRAFELSNAREHPRDSLISRPT